MKSILKGGLVDFKENYIFELEKNTPQNGVSKFTKKCIDKYGYKESVSDLYRKIVNYQIKTFGKTLEHIVEISDREECYKKCVYMNKLRYERRKGRKSDEK